MYNKNCPLIGDNKYKKFNNISIMPISNLILKKITNLNRHALHSCKLEFYHPYNNRSLSFTNQLEQKLESILNISSKDPLQIVE